MADTRDLNSSGVSRAIGWVNPLFSRLGGIGRWYMFDGFCGMLLRFAQVEIFPLVNVD